MKQIKAIPKQLFEAHFTNKEFEYYDYACFISILDNDNDEQRYDGAADNFLQVKMWDIERDVKDTDGTVYEKPPDSELKKIVEFVNKHKDKTVFVIHCTAGVSRSGAVATFLHDKFLSEIDKEQFRRENKHIMPNLYILNRLKELDDESTIKGIPEHNFFEVKYDKSTTKALNTCIIDVFKDYFKNLKYGN